MLPGEISRAYVSDNVKMSVYYESIDNLAGGSFTLHVPSSVAETLYSTPTASLTLPISGLERCRINDSDYIHLSLMSYEFVTYTNSERLLSSLVRYSASLPAGIGATSSPLEFNTTDKSFHYDAGHVKTSYSDYNGVNVTCR